MSPSPRLFSAPLLSGRDFPVSTLLCSARCRPVIFLGHAPYPLGQGVTALSEALWGQRDHSDTTTMMIPMMIYDIDDDVLHHHLHMIDRFI